VQFDAMWLSYQFELIYRLLEAHFFSFSEIAGYIYFGGFFQARLLINYFYKFSSNATLVYQVRYYKQFFSGLTG